MTNIEFIILMGQPHYVLSGEIKNHPPSPPSKGEMKDLV